MTMLTDSEQIRLLAELYNKTTQKIEAALKRYGLDRIPAEVLKEVQALRNEQKRQHGRGRGVLQAIWHGVGIIKTETDKLFKE
jgi:DNA primase large subunit